MLPPLRDGQGTHPTIFRTDREGSDLAEAKSSRLKEKIAGLRQQIQAVKAIESRVEDAPDQDVSLSDPGARSMATSGKGTATLGGNVQIAVATEHPLIVAHEAIRQGCARRQLALVALKAQPATGCQQVSVPAARGYFDGDQLLSCEATGVAPVIPKTLTSGNANAASSPGKISSPTPRRITVPARPVST